MKRSVLGVIVATLAVVTTRCSWPMFRFGPEQSGFTPDASISKTDLQAGLPLKWTATAAVLPGPSPAVVNGVVYATSAPSFGVLAAYDAAGVSHCSGTPATCQPLWTSAVAASSSAPAVLGNVVYVTSSDQYNGAIYGYDAAGATNCSGTPKVCSPVDEIDETGRGLMGSPIVADGAVYVSGREHISANETIPYICKCIAPTGGWTVDGIGGDFAVANGVVYVDGGSSPDGGQALWALDASTGAALWHVPGIGGGPTVVNGVIYDVNGFFGVYAFDAATGTQLWMAPNPPGGFLSEVAVANGLVYVTSGNGDNKLYVYDANGSAGCSGAPKTCTPLWSGTTTAPVGGGPSVANGVVYVGAGDGVYAFDAAGSLNCSGTPKTCQPLWKGPTAPVGSDPVIADGKVYVATRPSDTASQLVAFGR